ncbi:MAG: hypothetical protein EOL97_05180 [Spirochaetia bacterium]|nr:hypothetical protein [Spirochaetia bacterium]
MKTLDLLDESRSVTKTLFLLSWPTITEQILLTFVNYVDTAMVGSLGAVATASVSINSSTIWLINGLLSSISVGFGVLIAKNIGSKNYKRAALAANQGLFAALIMGLFFFLVMSFIGPKIPYWLKADASIYKDSLNYIKWITIAFIPQALMIMSGGIFRSSGNTKIPFLVNVINNLINICLNFFLIFPSKNITILNKVYLIKRANLGVQGAAIATCISITISLILIIFLLIKDKDLNYNIRFIAFKNINWNINKNATKLALPYAFVICTHLA